MDEVSNDLSKVRAMWSAPTSTTAKAKAQRRKIEKAAKSGFWTGRSAQMNIRMTPELKDDVQKAAADFGMSMADFFESAVLAFISSKRGKP
jgi:hypothetical protein